MKFLIDFTDDASLATIDQYIQVNQLTVLTKFNQLNQVYLVQATSTPPTDSCVVGILDDDVCPITTMDTTVPVVPIVNTTIVIDPSDIKQWWKLYSTNNTNFSIPVELHHTDNIVYLVDSGIDSTHEEFSGRRVELLHSFTGEFSDNTGHGTALASVINGNTCGLTDCVLKVVKLLDNGIQSKTSDLLKALDAIIADSLQHTDKLLVANLSWSIPRNQYIENKIQFLINNGIVVIVAAGNSGIPIEDATPAAMKDVVTIGSYSQNLSPSNFSNYGGTSTTSLTTGLTNFGQLDGWAPGEQIWSATTGGGYGFTAGTSIAAAIHSGCAMYNSVGTVVNQNFATIFLSRQRSAEFIQYCFGRLDILNLSNPRYSNSINHISTFFSTPIEIVPNSSSNTATTIAPTTIGNTSVTLIFSAITTQSYEIIGALPVWCIIEGAFLIAQPPIDTPVGSVYINFNILTNAGTQFYRQIEITVQELQPGISPHPFITITPLLMMLQPK